MKIYKGNKIPHGEYYVRKDNVVLSPENPDGLRDKREFPSINQAKRHTRELMGKGFQITTK
jgi:hypothetical protein